MCVTPTVGGALNQGTAIDRIVQCTSCERGCIKIKCTYKYCECTAKEVCSSCDRDVYLERVNGELQLKNGSSWYCTSKSRHIFFFSRFLFFFLPDVKYCDFFVGCVECAVFCVMSDPLLRSAI